ncbi:zf-RING_2 domain-containing protein [Cephalotus follicularis]|uniref:Zf-RING_2 domain-containing protein n=1 Tax=Cephalotus follicularis TaxID=3775 RepID=A0A1Q3BMU7_CEPFO|nr:zf-RING_2 domain-containing protein [Cephalotus follicularis]
MGSSGSKSSSSSVTVTVTASNGSGRKGRSKGNRVFQSSCLGTPSGSRDVDNDESACDHGNKENDNNASCTNQSNIESDEVKMECFGKIKDEQSVVIPCDAEQNQWGQASITDTYMASRSVSTSARSPSNQSFNPSTGFLSRLSFIPGNVSFRLSRATTLGSSRAYPVSSTSFVMLNNEEEDGLCPGPASGMVDRNESQQGRDTVRCHEDAFGNLGLNDTRTSGSSDSLSDNRVVPSISNVAEDGGSDRAGVDLNLCSPRILNDSQGIGTRLADMRTVAREPVERNVRFSRTLSVGRLRDRVLRRSSLSDIAFCPVQQEREVRGANQGGRQGFGSETMVSEGDAVIPTITTDFPSGMSSTLLDIPYHEVETSRSREARYHNLLEHRSHVLERRRRIRSQVRALQRLGSRFENLSGHERSCILSGQHRMGCCTCRISTQNANVNDDTTSRASISRIVMLAEALFEVLDEIHQQSVVLSSRPSISSIGSLPAPNEVVESLPVKIYTKLQKNLNEDAAQCYICLVEYEEGNSMRILPCNHEFHRACIDKWLKEIHRVCPLCRGDICRPDLLPVED